MNFWQELNTKSKKEGRPLYCLAPMADVTDRAYRFIVAKYSRYGGEINFKDCLENLPAEALRVGGPDVMWTEFVSADGLAHPIAREKLKIDLMYTEAERPIVAQLFSSNPENMKSAVKYCIELGFDGIDINMGCPDKSIEKQGAGASMIKTPEVARAVIASAREAITESGKDIPLSVKTRVGYLKPEIDTWIKMLLELDLDALSVHARTRRDMSKVPANWDYISEIVKMRDEMGKKTLIIGNGDVLNLEDANEKAHVTGADGIMIGRAVFGNPWIFNQNIKTKQTGGNFYAKFLSLFGIKNKFWLRAKTGVTQKEKLKVLFEHSQLFDELLGDEKSFAIMKKHFKAYINGFDGAKELRHKLIESKDFEDFKKNFPN